MICDAGTVVVVPYPFVEHPVVKVRPAVIISRRAFNVAGHSLVAMITTAARSSWPEDRPLQDWAAAGLKRPCIVRFKIFTLQNEAVQRDLGRLTTNDLKRVHESLDRVLSGED